MEFTLDMNASADYAKKLGRLHKSALPTAVRATLNNAAFDVKKNTLLKSAKKNFVERDKNFFKANSRVEKADGWNVSGMKATVGMISRGGTNHAVEELEQQEHGGTIGHKSFIAMRTARTGKSARKKTKSDLRLGKIRSANFTPVNKRSGSKKMQFIKAAFFALSKGDGYVLGNKTRSGGRTLWKIDRISSTRKTKRLFIKATPLYNVKQSRSVKVDATHFMRDAAEKSALKMPMDFKREAERQFKKYLG